MTKWIFPIVQLIALKKMLLNSMQLKFLQQQFRIFFWFKRKNILWQLNPQSVAISINAVLNNLQPFMELQRSSYFPAINFTTCLNSSPGSSCLSFAGQWLFWRWYCIPFFGYYPYRFNYLGLLLMGFLVY